MTNQSTVVARALVEWLLNNGVQEAVIAPGSRSAPLSYALAQASAAGCIQMHVRIDERAAGFLALGLAKASGKPVPVVVTSGTAVANLLPAVIESYYSGIELIVLSADRPAAQRGRRSPQTIAQANIFGEFAKVIDLAVAAEIGPALAGIRIPERPKVPLHINAQFDLPLLPTEQNWTPKVKPLPEQVDRKFENISFEVPSNGLIIAGDFNDVDAVTAIAQLAKNLGWPIIWEPTSNLHSAANSVSHGVLLLSHLPTPDCILTVGSIGLSRVVLAALKETKQHLAIHLASEGPEVADPVGTAEQIFDHVPTLHNQPSPSWFAEWQSAAEKVAAIVQSSLSMKTLTGQKVAVELWNHAKSQDQLFIAASWPVRHVEAYASTRQGLKTFGNRGANGIDGLISTAWGTALNNQNRTYLLIGDIAFLHDVGGLNVASTELQPNLTIVVSDNDGSGIFSQLEQGAPEYAQHFEKIFGTPHGKDLWVIAEALGIPAQRVTTTDELNRALINTDKIPGVHVIVCITGSRNDEVALIKEISIKAAEVLQ